MGFASPLPPPHPVTEALRVGTPCFGLTLTGFARISAARFLGCMTGGIALNVGSTQILERRRSVKLPKIKTLNHQIDVIEASSTATEARLANIEKLLERIAGQLDKTAV